MKIFRFFTFSLFLLFSGCTFLYSHSFKVAPDEALSQEEIHNVFVKFRAYLNDKGMREVPRDNGPDHAVFLLGHGKSGLLREPFEEYLELSYMPENGFTLKITRVIDQPVDFSEQYIADFKTKTEQFIREATSRSVRLQIIKMNP